MACDLHAAGEAFEKAWLACERGSLVPRRKAETLDFLGSLRRDQRRFDDALVCLERALELYRLYHDHGRVAKVLNTQATVFVETSQPERAVALARQAISLIDGEREPHLLLVCYHNLVIYLCESNMHAEAARLLPLVEEYQHTVGGPIDYTRFIWIRGKVAYGLKQFGKAEAFFLSAQHRFTELGDACNAAAAVLDLASCYLEEGRETALVYLAAEALPIFQLRRIPREAMAALELFHRSLELQSVTHELISEVRIRLRQSQLNNQHSH